MPVQIAFGARTDTGCVRQNNEDAYGLAPDLSLFVLSDGMGGLTCGEIASSLAVDTIITYCREAESHQPAAEDGSEISCISEHLAEAVRRANQAVYQLAEHDPSGKQMGATVVAVRFSGERMSIAHIGDSRVYRLRGDDFEQLTDDHSFVEEQVRLGRMTRREAGTSTMQNVLVRALGVDSDVEVDVSEELVSDNDTVLLCSDGLTRELTDDQIAAVLRETDRPETAASHLVDFAKRAGGADNITAIVLRPHSGSSGVGRWLGNLRRWFR
jgi:PPM family protein phosphatase